MTCGRFLFLGLLLLAQACPGLSQEMARPPGPAVVFASGYIGDHIVHIGDGGDEAVRLYGARDVGFKFTVVSLACFHLWTWGGTYCVYERVLEGDRLTEKYRPISDTEAARLLGKKESELTTPFWYRFPPGVLLLLALFAWCLIAGLVRLARRPRPPVESSTPGI